MKKFIRETHQVLEALGFEEVEDRFGRHDRRIYRHSYEPDTKLSIFNHATEAACRAIQARAHQIAGLGKSGPKTPQTIGDRKKNHRRLKNADRLRIEKLDQERRERAAKKEAEWRATQQIEARARRDREIASLMMPGGRR